MDIQCLIQPVMSRVDIAVIVTLSEVRKESLSYSRTSFAGMFRTVGGNYVVADW
jgi:hypothetical protein